MAGGVVIKTHALPTVEARPLGGAMPGASNVDITAFGGLQAQQMAHAAKELERGADKLDTAATKALALENEAYAKDADTQFANEMRALLFDGEKGYFSKRGKDAIDQSAGTLTAIEELRAKYSNGLQNRTEARRLFDDVAKRRSEQVQDQIARHVTSERRAYADAASNARVSTFITDAGTNFSDQGKVDQSLAGVRAEILSQAQATGEDAAVTLSKIKAAESEAVLNQIKGYLQTGNDPYQAKAVRDAYGGKLLGDHQRQADVMIREGLLRRGSADNAETIRSGGTPALVSSAVQFFQKEGGFAPHQAAAIVGNLHEESKLSPTALRPKDGRDGSDSIGVAQWNADRAKALKKWAADNGLDPGSRETQYRFVLHELQTSESEAGKKLRAATTVEEANDAMIGFLRPSGSEKGVKFAHNYGGRLRESQRAASGAAIEAPEVDPRTGKPTLKWQLAEVDKIADPELREATRTRVKSLHTADEAVVTERRRMISLEVQGMIMNGKLTSVDQVPVDKWTALEADQQRAFLNQMEQNARGKDNPPNPGLYAELSRQLVEDPEAFKKRDLVPLAAQLPNAHWTHFQNLQVAMGRRENAEEEKRASVAKALKIAEPMIQSAGVYLGYRDTKGKTLKEKDYEDLRSGVQAALLEETEAFQKENRRRPTDDELQKMADRLLMQGRVRDTGTFSDDKTLFFRRPQAEGAGEFYVRYGDIPSDRRKIVEDQLKAKGRPHDKRAVEQAYTAWRLAGNRQ